MSVVELEACGNEKQAMVDPGWNLTSRGSSSKFLLLLERFEKESDNRVREGS
jgi:hypothetical protein